MASQTALLLGATGQVGQNVLKELLANPHFTKVGEYGRRVTNTDNLTTGKDKLVQKTIDFEKLGESGLKEGKWDVVFIAMGTTKKAAGSAEAFVKIDREYVVNAAREAKTDSPQRLVYVSSIGANPSASFLYPQSKGLTEVGLAGLGYSDTIVFRPGYLAGTSRGDSRVAESILGAVTGLMSHFSSNVEIQISTLGKSIVAAGKLGSAALPPAAQATKAGNPGAEFTLITNSGALGLAKEV
ncbi:hypothetical protein BDZ94DRAFT_252586 [Collybia nuda]|uniref:NAD(P)-binding domain-containing protein n=1 Tax=Collybia nuda TaxID=64659 RepID=A0A9P5YBG5_9AGAR|nr:hypothetical protein BDZ94DRAFT_252586 [Collybia nuda]